MLRPPRQDDFAPYAAFYASDRTAHIGGPRSEAEAWRLFAADAGHWALKGFGWFTIMDHATGAAVGTTGLHHPPHHADVEIGWTLYEAGTGKGYATEAARAVLDWARETRGRERIVSYIDVENTPSQRVAARLGAATDGTRAAHNSDCEVWLHPAPNGATA